MIDIVLAKNKRNYELRTKCSSTPQMIYTALLWNVYVAYLFKRKDLYDFSRALVFIFFIFMKRKS